MTVGSCLARDVSSTMARGGGDSDEERERHDRFRSERTNSSLKPLSTVSASNTFSNRRQFDDRREGMRDFNRSSDDRRRRERSRSRGRRRSAERDRGLRQDKSYRDYEKPRRRRSDSAEINEHRRQYHKESKGSGSDDSRSRKYGRSSSDRRSGSLSSQDGRSKRTSRRSRSREYEKTKEDTFIKKFGGRRDLSSETHVIVDDVEYRDDTPSPDRSKPKKKKHEDKDKKKEKRRHDKKKKKKCSHKNSSDKESDALAVLDDSAAPRLDEVDDKEIYCPKLPPARREAPKILPTLPASSEESLPGNRSTDDVDKPKIGKMVSEAPEEFYGPKIPPKSKPTEIGLLHEDVKCEEKSSPKTPHPEPADNGVHPPKDPPPERVYGPALPARAAVADVADEEASYGPALPPTLAKPKETPGSDEDSDDGGCYGPQPAGMGGRTLEELEIRAALIKKQLEIKEDGAADGPKKRETWMTELPDSRRADFGFGPRKFRAREGPDPSADRSSWTDTPEMKKTKEELARLGIDVTEDNDNDDSRRLGIELRDKEMEKKARQDKKKKKKDKSLLEMHQKKLKKKKKKELEEKGGKEERRPFNRETDLQTNRFDDAQKRSIIKKAQLLDSRFSRGESKFL